MNLNVYTRQIERAVRDRNERRAGELLLMAALSSMPDDEYLEIRAVATYTNETTLSRERAAKESYPDNQPNPL